MKRTSFVCFGAPGSKDALVYQEIPGRDGGEEFFLFFSPGDPGQETLFRALFREAVSASRLGAPAHYFLRFFDQFKAIAGNESGGNAIEGALLMIMIRRGEDVHLLCNRDASLIHWDCLQGEASFPATLKGFTEIPLGGDRGQRDLFERAPEDALALFHFTISGGEHVVALVPSREFFDLHAGVLRESIFLGDFEIPRETGISLDLPRSLPALRWRGEEREEIASPKPSRAARSRRPVIPVAAALLVAAIAILAILRGAARERRPTADASQTLLSAQNAEPEKAAPPSESKEEVSESSPEAHSLSESWKQVMRDAVTSSPQFHKGLVYFGCRDGSLYAFAPDGELRWQFRSGAGIGASPSCSENRVVCANYRGDVFCLDAGTGTSVWSFASRSKIVSSPRIRRDLVVAGTSDGRLIAIRLGDGTKLWEKKLAGSIWATPSVGKDYVIAATTGGTLYRLDHRGTVVWKATPGGEIRSSPVCVEDKDIVVFGTKGGDVQAVSLASGALAWRFRAGGEVNGSPLAGEDRIYIGGENKKLYAFALDGELIWERDVGGAVLSRPLLVENTVFVTTYAGRLVALNARDGAVIKEYRAASPLYSSPEWGDKRIFFGSNGGVFHALWL